MADDFTKAGPHDPCVPDYHGVPVDPATGRILDPFRCRDPKNAKRTNPPNNTRAILDDRADEYWGLE